MSQSHRASSSVSNMPLLGIIEGFYGKPWGFAKRRAYIEFMKEFSYSFFIYAPKADKYFREAWHEAIPEPLIRQLTAFGKELREENIAWSVGLSPFDLHKNFNTSAKTSLLNKLKQLEAIGTNWLAILFDDMNGDDPLLAEKQVEICHFIRDNSNFDKLLMCPSYYSFDPVLEQVFGKMPESYWQDLGKGLDDAIEIFWTGEKVCSSSYSAEHLQEVQALLGRRPFLWDNYPVNDGVCMSPFLHLSQWQGRESCTNTLVSGLAVNPMNEAMLSQIPLAGLSTSIGASISSSMSAPVGASLSDLAAKIGREKASREKTKSQISAPDLDSETRLKTQSDAQYDTQFKKLCQRFAAGAGSALVADKHLFEDLGFHEMSEEVRETLIEKYQRLRDEDNSAFIDELIEYLKGHYLSDVNDVVATQTLWE